MEFKGITKSPNPLKKWRATFETAGREKHTDFGDAHMQDYTQHHNKERREAYRSRHKNDLRTGDPSRAGYLSWWILWGDSTSLRKNISTYKNKYF